MDGHAFALLGTGFCGGLTTYSAFAVQSVRGGRRQGTAYVVVSVAGCLALATLGHLLAKHPPLAWGPCPISCSATCGWCRCAESRRRPGRWTSGSPTGRSSEVGPALPARGPEVDADGRWLVPGLWDQHVHLGQWTLATLRLDLTGTRSVEEALARVATRLVRGTRRADRRLGSPVGRLGPAADGP